MAGIQTDPSAHAVHGTNPQFLVPKIVREKVWQMTYWKERCFGVSAAALVDLAMELRDFGGVYGGTNKCTDFLCLVLKMLQIQPDKDIVIEFIKNEDYKYVRLLGAFYLRLVGKPLEVYQYLEPLYNDYRRVRRRGVEGKFTLCHVDELVEELLSQDSCCDVTLPRIPHRWTLEATGVLLPRRSVLEEGLEGAAGAQAEAAPEAAQPQAEPGRGPLSFKGGVKGDGGKRRRSRSRSCEREAREVAVDEVSQANALRAQLGLKPLRAEMR